MEGDLAGELHQFTQNIRPSQTDFCGGNAGYSGGDVHNAVWGTFTFDQGNCSLVINELEGLTDGGFPLPFYAAAGPSVEYKMISRHFLRERRNGEGSLERIYERRDFEIAGIKEMLGTHLFFYGQCLRPGRSATSPATPPAGALRAFRSYPYCIASAVATTWHRPRIQRIA